MKADGRDDTNINCLKERRMATDTCKAIMIDIVIFGVENGEETDPFKDVAITKDKHELEENGVHLNDC